MDSKATQNTSQVCVLLSGGLDSAACLAFYIHRKIPTRALHIDYGQSASVQEDVASTALAAHFQVQLLKLRVQGVAKKGSGMIYGRNAFLLFTAFMELCDTASIFATGIHAGAAYADCSNSFVDSIQRVFDLYTGGVARVAAPFMSWTKRQIWEFSIQKSVPTDLTYSCEVGGTVPCGRCLSCKDMEALRAA